MYPSNPLYSTYEDEEENPFLRPVKLFPDFAAGLPEEPEEEVFDTFPEEAVIQPPPSPPPKPEEPEEEVFDTLPEGAVIQPPPKPSEEEEVFDMLPEGAVIQPPTKEIAEDDLGKVAPEVKQSDWLDGINEVMRGASSEGVLMGMEGLYAMVEQRTKGTFLEGLFKPAGEQRQAMTALRERVRQGLPVDRDFAESTAGQVLEGVGQLANLPLYAVPVVGTAMGAGLSFGQLYQEAKEDYLQTRKAQGLPIDEAAADRAALEYMAGAGALEIASDKLIVGKFLKAAKKSGFSVGDVLKGIGTMAGAGAVSEGGQELVLNKVANYFEGYDPERKFDENIYQSALVGGLIGGVGGGVAEAGGALAGRAQRAAAPPAEPSRAADLERAAAAVPGLGQEIAAETGEALQQAAAAVPAWEREQALQQADLLRQAAVQAPGLAADPERAALLRQAAEQAPGLAGENIILPGEPVSNEVRTGLVQARLDQVKTQLAGETDSVRATELEKEKAVLENKVESAKEVTLVKETSARVAEAGAPKTAQALEASTVEALTARDQIVHGVVEEAPDDIFAEEEVSPAGPRRGEPGFVSPPGGEVIGARPPVPEMVIPPGGVSVPVMMTKRMEVDLREKGFTQQQIDTMTPAQAWEHLKAPTPAVPTPAPGELAPAPEAEGEVVLRPGIKGQEAVVQRPSARIQESLAGQQVAVEVISTNGEKKIQNQDAATALMDLKKDKTGFTLLTECLQ